MLLKPNFTVLHIQSSLRQSSHLKMVNFLKWQRGEAIIQFLQLLWLLQQFWSKCKGNFIETTRTFFAFCPDRQWEYLFIYCKWSQQDMRASFQSAIILLWIIFNLWWCHYAKIITPINTHIVNIIIKTTAHKMNLPLLSNPCVNSWPTITPIAP
jgi:hypothetical protein